MSDPVTVNRYDIRLVEEQVPFSITQTQIVWFATFDGYLSSGEAARIVRRGPDAASALRHLETALEVQGWTVLDDSGEP